jgi:PKD repeat protein
MIAKRKSGIVFVLMVLLAAAWAWAEPVSLETAETAAQNWINARTAGQGETYKRSDVFTVNEKSEPACYVFNFTPNGWVIISADDAARPVIAYSLEGAYSPENHPPAFDAWMDVVKQAISNLPIKKALPAPETTDEWLRLTEDTDGLSPKTRSAAAKSVAPLIQTAWGQDPPYNAQCPPDDSNPEGEGHAFTGCVATAMAQIMKYHSYPETGYGSHSYVPLEHPEYGTLSADFGATTYNWSAMPAAETNPNFELARLLFHCGVAVEMDFGPFYSGANMENDARNAFKDHFRYEESLYAVRKSNYTDEQWEALLKAELDAQRPMLYAGKSSAGGGHSFICDGYDDAGLFHFNWGWVGTLDGYFSLTSLIPDINNDYTLDQNAVIRIQTAREPHLALPYAQGFESGLPEEWIFSGERAKITSDQSHSGGSAIMLSDQDSTGIVDFAGGNVNIAALKINVPANGAVLSFWVKRENNNPASPSWFNKQIGQIRPQFGPEPLLELFNGDFKDNQWQNFSVSLTPWKGTVVTLYFEVNKAFTTPQTNQWMYIDDVEILANETPVSDFKAQTTEACTGIPVQFSDLSSFFPTTWSWSFPGGNPASATEQNPMVIYDAPGTYTVTLTAGNGLGEGTTETKALYVHIYNTPLNLCTPITIDILEPEYYLGIFNVTLNTLNHSSGGTYDDGGYKDFCCIHTTSLTPDTDYDLSVTVGDVNPEYVKVYIDSVMSG